MARKRSSLTGFTRQVRAEGRLRYGSQKSALLRLLDEAASTAKTRAGSVEAGTRGLQQALEGRVSDVGRAFEEAGRTRSAIADRVEARTSGLGSTADPFRGIIEGEIADADRRAAEAKSRSDVELSDQRTSIARDKQSRLAQISQDLQGNALKVGGQLEDLAKERGAFGQARLGELVQGRRERQHESRNLRAKTRADLREAKVKGEIGLANSIALEGVKEQNKEKFAQKFPSKSGAKKPARGLGSKTEIQEQAIHDKVDAAKNAIAQLRANNPDHKIYELLRTGGSIPVPTGQKDAQGNPKFSQRSIPQVPSDILNAAFDLVVQGHLSPANIKALHGRGLHIPSAWRPPKSKKRPSPRQRRAQTHG